MFEKKHHECSFRFEAMHNQFISFSLCETQLLFLKPKINFPDRFESNESKHERNKTSH